MHLPYSALASRVRRVPMKSKVLVLALLLLLPLLLWLAPTRGAAPEDGMRRDPQGLFLYDARRTAQGTEVLVVWPADDPETVERYRAASNERARALLEAPSGARFWTTITLARPLEVGEMRELLASAKVEAFSFTQGGQTASGQRMGSTFWADHPDFDLDSAATSVEESPAAGATRFGFVVIQGYITATPESLGRLLDDPRVYLVDTTAHEVLRLLRISDRSDETVTFSLPTPFWTMEWK